MDIEKKARRQSRRVIISEILMVITVIATVSILAFVVSGYWVGSDFKIERQGLLQVYSAPTGASVEIDGNPTSWLERTNTSKTLAAGEHTIKLTKDGYDSWSRTININEGLLYRLHYPRLFLQDRAKESAYDFSANFATITPDRNYMLLVSNTTKWQLINLDTDNIKPTAVDLSEILPFASRAENASEGLFSGTVKSAKWATDNEHVLLQLEQDGTTNYLVVNVKNPSSSVNLTKEFHADFSKVEIINSSASNLLVILNGNLHRIDVSAKQLSAVIVPSINSFDYHDQDVVFSAKTTDTTPKIKPRKDENGEPVEEKPDNYYIGLIKLGSSEITNYKYTTAPLDVEISKFYDDEYILTVEDKKATLYLKNDFVKKSDYDLAFHPDTTKVGPDGEFIAMSAGGRIASLDMEAMAVTEWETGTDKFGWLDGSMVYAVKDGTLNVYDFDGQNPRTLASNVSSRFPITITADKYLYYTRDDTLIREWLVEK